MKAYRAVIGLALVFSSGIVSAQTTGRAFDINLNDDTVAAAFAWRLGEQKLLADVGWLHNQDRGDVIHGSLHIVDAATAGDDPLQAGLGLKLAHVSPDPISPDGTVLALGGFVRYTLPNANRFHIGGQLYYAPDVVAFGDAKEYYDVAVRVSYNVIRDGDVYLGLREVKAKFEGTSRFTMDSGLHIGFQYRF